MKIKSYAKVNLTLRVFEKQANNFHNIESLVTRVNLHDLISIKKHSLKKDIVIFKGKFRKNVNPKKNSIKTTLKILRRLGVIKFFYKISIDKKIPIFAGLGGGSSNAAFVARFFLKNFHKNRNLKIFTKEIGTDFKLFFFNQSFQKSLSKIEKLKKKLNFHLILVHPGFKSKTKEVYSKVKILRKKSKIRFKDFENTDKTTNLLIREKNDLQQIVENKHPRVTKIINFIQTQKGCFLSRITGSGSVCFGLFKSQKAAKKALKKIKKKFPHYWCVTTKTI